MKQIRVLIMIIALASAGTLQAQTCSSEVMQFRETFGKGGGDAALPAGRTNYTYNSTSALSDGEYKLNKSSHGKPEWHDGSDHTGDPSGRMMVVNASFAPGEFYRDTVYTLSFSSTYSVYLYAMNVNTVGTCSPNPILPRLQLIVESYNSDGSFTQIGSLVSADLPQTATPTWVKISGYFNLPVGVTAVRYRILNNATGGCGNDLAIDDITFSQCAQIILPVSGFSLKAKNAGSAVELSWLTLQESHTSRFLLEKSSDARNWTLVTSVKAAGESNDRKDYAAIDNSPFASVTYYRVSAEDNDGKLTYSNTVKIKPSSTVTLMRSYPNPFNSTVGLEINVLQNQQASVRLFDLNGKMLKNIPLILKAGSNVTAVNGLENLVPGLYFLDVTDNSGTSLYKTKLVKRS